MSRGWEPKAKYRLYLQRIREILTEEKRTVRDVYYALEARGFPDECADRGIKFDYRFVKRAVKKGRRHGFIDPDLIVDTSRPVVTDVRQSHPEPEKFMRNNERHIKHGYFENFWEDQQCYVEVWLEKASLASVFEPICDEYNVRLEATRGDWSDSKVYEAVQRLHEPVDAGKDVKILYFGDFNPSGLHAPVAIQSTMGHYGMPMPLRDPNDPPDKELEEMLYFDIWPHGEPWKWSNAPGTIEFERVALNLEHVQTFDLAENPTPSKSDKDRKIRERFMENASEGRDVNIELNALKEFERDFLERTLEEAITEYIDTDVRADTEARVDRRQELLREAMGEVDYGVFEDA